MNHQKQSALVSVFPEAWRERRMDASFEHGMVEKKNAETQLVLTSLDWIIVRPSARSDAPGAGQVHLGFAKVHPEISRDDVAATIVEPLRTPGLNRLIVVLAGGGVPNCEEVGAMASDSPTNERVSQ